MSEPVKNLFDSLLDQIRVIVREEITVALNGGIAKTDSENLLTPDEAAALMNVNPRWLYRHAAKLPFTRRINRKNLRFSEASLRRWLATKRPVTTR